MPRPKSRSVTSRDVALESGVSQATVSYVINDVSNQKISPETRKRVLDAALRLGYTPSESARALRSGRSNLALLIFPNFQLSYGIDQLVSSLSAQLALQGLTLVMHRLGEGPAPLRAIWRAISPGVIIGLGALDAEEQAEIRAAGIAVAIFQLSESNEPGMGVIDYQQKLGRMQVEHLVAHGYTGIGYAMPPDANLEPFWKPRFEGVRQACAAAMLAPPVDLVVPLHLEGAVDAVSRWKAVGVTAVAAYNDDTALAVLGGMNGAGVRCPEDMAVIGIDAIPTGAVSIPALTTIEIDMTHLAVQFSKLVGHLHTHHDGSVPDGLESIQAVVINRSTV